MIETEGNIPLTHENILTAEDATVYLGAAITEMADIFADSGNPEIAKHLREVIANVQKSPWLTNQREPFTIQAD